MARDVAGSKPRGNPNLLQCGKLNGWTQELTASSLRISQQAVAKATKIATAIEEYPDLAKKTTGQAVLTEFKRRELNPDWEHNNSFVDVLAQITGKNVKTIQRYLSPKYKQTWKERQDVALFTESYQLYQVKGCKPCHLYRGNYPAWWLFSMCLMRRNTRFSKYSSS